MRVLVDLIDSIGTSIRFIFLLFFLAIFGFGALISAGAFYAAPKVADSVAAHAERYEERAEAAAHNREMGQEGWGYRSGDASERKNTAGQFGEDNGGWADDNQYRY